MSSRRRGDDDGFRVMMSLVENVAGRACLVPLKLHGDDDQLQPCRRDGLHTRLLIDPRPEDIPE